jgi:hypothetical protein
MVTVFLSIRLNPRLHPTSRRNISHNIHFSNSEPVLETFGKLPTSADGTVARL